MFSVIMYNIFERCNFNNYNKPKIVFFQKSIQIYFYIYWHSNLKKLCFERGSNPGLLRERRDTLLVCYIRLCIICIYCELKNYALHCNHIKYILKYHTIDYEQYIPNQVKKLFHAYWPIKYNRLRKILSLIKKIKFNIYLKMEKK